MTILKYIITSPPPHSKKCRNSSMLLWTFLQLFELRFKGVFLSLFSFFSSFPPSFLPFTEVFLQILSCFSIWTKIPSPRPRGGNGQNIYIPETALRIESPTWYIYGNQLVTGGPLSGERVERPGIVQPAVETQPRLTARIAPLFALKTSAGNSISFLDIIWVVE